MSMDWHSGKTARLAGFLSELTFSELPDDVVVAAQSCLLDTLGVAVFASQLPWSHAAADVSAISSADGPATYWGRAGKAGAPAAAFANGVAAHGIEMDDRSPDLNLHPGCHVVPAAFAAAQQAGAGGRALLVAIVAGYEMEFRVARAAGAQLPGLTGVVHKGVFGATAAAAKALGAGHEPTMNALGIAGSMASGIKEYYNDPAHTMVKRLNGGWAAQSGTLAALLGQRGYTGPWTVLEGRYGYLNVFSKPGAVEPDLLVDGLGERFAVVDREVKPYAAWGGSHVVIDAIRDLTGAVPIRLDEIDEIHISCSARLVRRRINRRPESVLAAQISLPFLTALAFVHDLADPRIWKDASILHDPELLGVVDRVHCVVDEARDRIVATDGGSGGAAVTVRLRGGGTRQAEVAHSRGSRQRPLGPGELVHKVRSIASDVLPLAQCDQIIAAVEALPHRTDLADLARLLQPVHVPVGAQT